VSVQVFRSGHAGRLRRGRNTPPRGGRDCLDIVIGRGLQSSMHVRSLSASLAAPGSAESSGLPEDGRAIAYGHQVAKSFRWSGEVGPLQRAGSGWQRRCKCGPAIPTPDRLWRSDPPCGQGLSPMARSDRPAEGGEGKRDPAPHRPPRKIS
jgi:hypothetical protein